MALFGPATPVASLQLRCQQCQATQDAMAGGMPRGQVAEFVAQVVNNFEREHEKCWSRLKISDNQSGRGS